ncbi:MAG TPA: DNA-directed RNA polymerase subunit omega [Candidatus Marinimicrobia bacterium]|nr:DNA-directed RNA polymerase subunit omega [Candidatus Neomarinimicrobiota bacterium]HRS51872.1 DNA-directed RNA polymerase subunit omega [Candidatus Neomarinimicrobiota bacterium]HRU92667.1 DNA-directed RNA polymerase subunit omega [Candidatus Neomarinimicrobiota bacterium]
MTETLPFDKLTRKSDDIFELVIVAARRARQINSLRMAQYPLPTMIEEQEETFEETPPEITDDQNWDELEKPTTLAINEILEDQINYRYMTPEEEKPLEEFDSEFNE